MAVSLRAKQTEVSARRGVDPSQRQHERAQAAQFVPPVTLSEWLSHSCCSKHSAACPCDAPLRQVLLSPPCRGGREGSRLLRAPGVFRSHRFLSHQTASFVCFWGCILCCQLGDVGRVSKSSCFFRTWNQMWKTPMDWLLWQAGRHFFQPGKQPMVNLGLEGTVQ